MKILIIINTIIPFLACIQSFRALIMSYAISRYVKSRSILFELTEHKVGYMKAGRFYIYLVLLGNSIWFLWGISRITNNFVPYATYSITFTSIIFSVILLLQAHLILIFFKGDGALKHFEKLKI